MDSKKNKPFSLQSRLKSFRYAFNGLKILLKDEHNARIHLIISIITCSLGIIFNISYYEWLAIIILIAIVVGLEIINSVVERLCDFICSNHDNRIKQIKDLMAAAVLLASIAAVICGFIIFLPKLYYAIF